jgi:hypothetical protein
MEPHLITGIGPSTNNNHCSFDARAIRRMPKRTSSLQGYQPHNRLHPERGIVGFGWIDVGKLAEATLGWDMVGVCRVVP